MLYIWSTADGNSISGVSDAIAVFRFDTVRIFSTSSYDSTPEQIWKIWIESQLRTSQPPNCATFFPELHVSTNAVAIQVRGKKQELRREGIADLHSRQNDTMLLQGRKQEVSSSSSS
eukprot:IDg2726t1